MAYVTQENVKTLVPAATLTQCLADTGDDSDVVWGRIATAASQAVDGLLERAYHVPFPEPVPSVVSEGALVFACEILYQRRGVPPDANPFGKRAADMRTRLERIGSGKEPLQPGANPSSASDSVAVVTEPSRLHPSGGMLSY